MLTCTPVNSISDGAVTSLLSALSILIEVLSHAHAKGKKALTFQVWHFFKFGTFIGHFPRGNVTSMAVKGLKKEKKKKKKRMSSSLLLYVHGSEMAY